MKTTTRRQLTTFDLAGGAAVAAAGIPLTSCQGGNKKTFSDFELKERFDKLDKVLKQPILKDL